VPLRTALFASALLVLLMGTTAVVRWSDEQIAGNAPEARGGEAERLLVARDGRWRDVSTKFNGLRSLWVRGCVRSGETVAFCRCAYNEYTIQLRRWEFDAMMTVALSDGTLAELPDHVRDALSS
jgi:hypothetical protein